MPCWQQICLFHVSSDGTSGKESACQYRRYKRHKFSPWVKKIPWRRKWQPTPVTLPGKFQGQRNLVGYSPWGHKELDMTEWLSSHTAHMFLLKCTKCKLFSVFSKHCLRYFHPLTFKKSTSFPFKALIALRIEFSTNDNP